MKDSIQSIPIALSIGAYSVNRGFSQSHLRATARAASTIAAVTVTANANAVPRGRGAAPAFEGHTAAGASVYKKRMVAARLRHLSASPTSSARCTGALHSVAARSKCVAASLSSAAERGPAPQVLYRPLSTPARMRLAALSFGAALTTLADSALSPSSFHHSGLATLAHSSFLSKM